MASSSLSLSIVLPLIKAFTLALITLPAAEYAEGKEQLMVSWEQISS